VILLSSNVEKINCNFKMDAGVRRDDEQGI